MNAASLAVSSFSAVLVGMLGLASAMGIGRFALTPVMPFMLHDAGLSMSQGSWLATANYIGYLAGALLCIAVPPRPTAAVRWGLTFGRGNHISDGTVGQRIPVDRISLHGWCCQCDGAGRRICLGDAGSKASWKRAMVGTCIRGCRSWHLAYRSSLLGRRDRRLDVAINLASPGLHCRCPRAAALAALAGGRNIQC